MCPNKENIIDIVKAYQKFKLLREEINFYFVHKNIMEANFVPMAVPYIWCLTIYYMYAYMYMCVCVYIYIKKRKYIFFKQ